MTNYWGEKVLGAALTPAWGNVRCPNDIDTVPAQPVATPPTATLVSSGKSGEYKLNWKTNKSMVGRCWVFTAWSEYSGMHEAYFYFR